MAVPADDASAPLLSTLPAAPAAAQLPLAQPPLPGPAAAPLCRVAPPPPPPPPPPPLTPGRPALSAGVRMLSGLRSRRMLCVSSQAASVGSASMTVRLLAPAPAPQPTAGLPRAAAPPAEPPAEPAAAPQAVACVIRRCLALQSPAAPVRLPQDAVQVVVDLAAASLLELLALALVDREFHAVAGRRFAHELRWLSTAGGAPEESRLATAGLSQLLVPQVAQQFVALPELMLSSPGVLGETEEEPSCQTFAHFGEDEALLHCQDCSTPILKADDIISSNYRIMTGRAYLASAAFNVTMSEETHEAHYTTGQYTVKDVSCSRCALKLGITYVRALDNQNSYKIGKFLVGQHLFVRPVCCLLRSRRLPAELPLPLCPRCQRTAVRGALQLVCMMTLGLAVCRTRQLYELLLRQSALETLAEPAEKTARRRIWAAPRALLSWCLPLFRKSPAACSYESLLRLGLEPSEMIPRLGVDLWQEAIQERFGLLDVLHETIQGEHLASSLTAVVRFVSAIVRVARNAAPPGATRPERVPLLLRLLPALVASGRSDALRGARALALAVRREWLHCPGGGKAEGSLSSAEMEAVARAITGHAAEGILEHLRAAAAAIPPGARLEPPVEGALSSDLPLEGAPLSPPLRPLAPGPPRSPSGSTVEGMELGGGAGRTAFWRAGLGLAEVEGEEPLSRRDSSDELLLQCLACGNPVLKADDILSSNYRITTGPAYLVGSAYNVQLSSEAHEAVYTSGQYTVRDASCVRCSARLGIMYTGASDVPNLYKVGKFLMGQDQLLLPPSGTALPKSEEALYSQLLELMNHGSIIPATESQEFASEVVAAGAAQLAPGAAAAAQGDRDPLVGGPAVAPPVRQRIVVTIKRYIRCIFPVVRYVPMASSWVGTTHRHAPRTVPQAPQ